MKLLNRLIETNNGNNQASTRDRWAPIDKRLVGCLVVLLSATAMIAIIAEATSLPSSPPPPSTSPQLASNQTQQVQQQVPTSNKCNSDPPCSSAEFSLILQKIVQNDDILRRFRQIETLSDSNNRSNISLSVSFDSGSNIRAYCVKELFNLIRDLASNELELKTMIEFASDAPIATPSLPLKPFQPGWVPAENKTTVVTQEIGLSKFRKFLSLGREGSGMSSSNSSSLTGKMRLDFGQIKWPSQQKRPQSQLIKSNGCAQEYERANSANQQTAAEQSNTLTPESPLLEINKSSKVLNKFVSNVDHWINTLERFTYTREWSSLLKIFQGTESIMTMFISSEPKPWSSTHKIIKSKDTINLINNSTTKTSNSSKQDDQELVERLSRELPGQVLTLTSALNSLFPWHVWPWNNLDLYSTIDTFLNHGIFAFSKTTTGPERRIDYLPELLQVLFKSMKYDSFPKKCNDWSKIICNLESYHDRLVLPDVDGLEAKDRQQKLSELAGVGKNKLTQELTCIMFSSLSMQHFGANEDIEAVEKSIPASGQNIGSSASLTGLPWDKQVQKALKLYTLSREALSDEEWMSLYKLINDLWSQQKVSDRVIMVGRVIQLITNCHMPKEMLESALWKDIYKYKNVLNQLVDFVTEELNRSSESGKLQIEQIALGSKNLHEILEKFLRLLPRLLESLSQTIVDQLPDLISKFFNEKATFFKVPCKGASFSDIISSLAKHRSEVVELEELVCRQLSIKPNITMMQINNLTNDFLAMAFNFSSIGNALAFPKLLMDDGKETAPTTARAISVEPKVVKKSLSESDGLNIQSSDSNLTYVSIIDEMAANPRLASIVAILQSSALDPPEVHAELPELDWVEAGTSIASLYETIQKLLSYDGIFVIFPEISDYQEKFKKHLTLSEQMFIKFSKRDPFRLLAYSLDSAMPIALRTYKPMVSFHEECQSVLKDLFVNDGGYNYEILASSNNNNMDTGSSSKASRQWQCLISSMNFGSWAMNKFMITFNGMFKNILAHKSNEFKIINESKNASSSNDSCIFFDGSVSLMLDNLPQFIDLSLETVLMASTTTSSNLIDKDDNQDSDLNDQESTKQLTLYDILCSSNYILDPFNDKSIELKAKLKDKMCHLFHKKSLTNCANVLKIDQWNRTMLELNSTWFNGNSLVLEPSFREITINVHEFLELFGQFKPSTMSDSLLARLLNVNSFWNNLSVRIMNIVDKYQEKRFEFALQTLTPIIHDNLPATGDIKSSSSKATLNETSFSPEVKEVRDMLITTILGAKTILNYLDKQSNVSSSRANKTSEDLFDSQIKQLLNWGDTYAMTTAEVLLRTFANNITKLEMIFERNLTADANAIQRQNHSTIMSNIWSRFCSSNVDKYLDLTNEIDTSSNSSLAEQLNEGKKTLCDFEWSSFYRQLSISNSTNERILLEYPERQLTRIALTKLGQLLDFMFIESKHIKQLPKFFYMQYWKKFQEKLPQISPLKDQPSNLSWIWRAFERLINAYDSSRSVATTVSKDGELIEYRTSTSLLKILEQLNCGLDAVKGGLSWENIANIYSDKQDILAAHSTINNGFALASIGLNTFIEHKKFQKFLNQFIKPKVGFNAFCEMRDRNQLESIFSIPNEQNFLQALESFQELICDTNFEQLAQNINPISICYSSGSSNAWQTVGSSATTLEHPLADIMDRFFKLASLAILDAKLVAANDVKPPILDKNQWSSFWSWSWSASHHDQQQQSASQELTSSLQAKSNLALSLVRVFQMIDSINSNHVVWKAFFKSVHELSEVSAYLLRAIDKKHQQQDNLIILNSKIKETVTQLDSLMKTSANNTSKTDQLEMNQLQQQQLASTLSNIMFPEVNNFISFKTFKQLRYIKTILNYFLETPKAQEELCGYIRANNAQTSLELIKLKEIAKSRLELINYKLSTNDKLYAILCHYPSPQWLTALNIIISANNGRISSISMAKKINYISKYLAIFTKNYYTLETNQLITLNNSTSKSSAGVPMGAANPLDSLESFIHSQQLENIENVSNTTISYLLATSQSIKSLSFSKISNISWHSLPNLLDSIDRHLCALKNENSGQSGPTEGELLAKSMQAPQINYQPKKIELEVLLCKLPQWNLTKIYDYLSENFDLQNMISLITQTSQQQQSFNNSNNSTNSNASTITNSTSTAIMKPVCITPFKFASKWLKLIQDTLDEFMSKSSKEKLKKCFMLSRKSQSVSVQSLRYMKYLNSLLAQLNDLTENGQWSSIRKTWQSISYLILQQTTAPTTPSIPGSPGAAAVAAL